MNDKVISPEQACPYNWRTGYPDGITVGCGGYELPTYVARKWYIYLWDRRTKLHIYYCFEDDLFLSEAAFEELKENN